MALWGTAAVGGGLLLAGWQLRRVGMDRALYHVYCTPVGKLVHSRMLSGFAGKAPHSDCAAALHKLGPRLEVQLVPMMGDNYAYLIVDGATGEVAAVDPADPSAVLAAIDRRRARDPQADLRLTRILTTHYHHDHCGGNEELASKFPGIKIIGAKNERWAGVSGLTEPVQHGDSFQIGEYRVDVIETPGHTQGHVCFHVPVQDQVDQAAVFSGDALFHAGVGRLFEMGPAELELTLYDRLWNLADSCLVFCGHEYSVSNLEFAAWLEPGNARVDEQLAWCRQRREGKLPTVPSTIGLEKLVNPFMRCDAVAERSGAMLAAHGKPEAIEAFSGPDRVSVLGRVRHLKDLGAVPRL